MESQQVPCAEIQEPIAAPAVSQKQQVESTPAVLAPSLQWVDSNVPASGSVAMNAATMQALLEGLSKTQVPEPLASQQIAGLSVGRPLSHVSNAPANNVNAETASMATRLLQQQQQQQKRQQQIQQIQQMQQLAQNSLDPGQRQVLVVQLQQNIIQEQQTLMAKHLKEQIQLAQLLTQQSETVSTAQPQIATGTDAVTTLRAELEKERKLRQAAESALTLQQAQASEDTSAHDIVSPATSDESTAVEMKIDVDMDSLDHASEFLGLMEEDANELADILDMDWTEFGRPSSEEKLDVMEGTGDVDFAGLDEVDELIEDAPSSSDNSSEPSLAASQTAGTAPQNFTPQMLVQAAGGGDQMWGLMLQQAQAYQDAMGMVLGQGGENASESNGASSFTMSCVSNNDMDDKSNSPRSPKVKGVQQKKIQKKKRTTGVKKVTASDGVDYMEFECGYCNSKKISMSTGRDGHVRIRCECGGKHGDNKTRMHAKWKAVRVIPGNTAEIPRFEIKDVKQEEEEEVVVEEQDKCSDEDKSDDGSGDGASACEESDEGDCVDIAMEMQ